MFGVDLVLHVVLSVSGVSFCLANLFGCSAVLYADVVEKVYNGIESGITIFRPNGVR